ncbi:MULTISPECIES: terpene synthase family protein [unclassified Streptomyces]|uniref:terpene synthase family protein n=1 Tax=unclassified Streptomyces TaxID=2593676 RepID=UPI003412036F
MTLYAVTVLSVLCEDRFVGDSRSDPDALDFWQVLGWARAHGLVTDLAGERRLAAMRLDVLACGALPRAAEPDVLLTVQWAVFICWVDDCIDRGGSSVEPGSLEAFTAPLRQVFQPGTTRAVGTGTASSVAAVLAGLRERTASGMPDRWRERLAREYADFLDATEQEVVLRQARTRLSLAEYVRLRRRTITLLPMLTVLERTGHALMVEDPRVDLRVRNLRWALADIAGWANDLASGGDDALAGQDNLVAVIAREEGCSTAVACSRAQAMIDQRRKDFAATAQALRTTPLPPNRGEELGRYLCLVEQFMDATLHWLSTTGRFTPGAKGSAARHAPTRS